MSVAALGDRVSVNQLHTHAHTKKARYQGAHTYSHTP